MVQRANWDDLRFVLAVAETGSVGAAARALGVNHATVLRRVAAFEQAHGGAVLRRSATGYEVLPERLPVIEAARIAAAAFDQAAALMQGGGGADRPVRVTSTDTLCQTLLPGVIAGLSRRPGAPRIELRCNNMHSDLARLEADISVRPALSLPADLVGLQAGELEFAVYRAAGASLQDLAWLGLGGALTGSVAGAWAERVVPAGRPEVIADSFPVLATLAAAGQGRAVLPTVLGDATPGLVRDAAFGVVASTPIWVAIHAELAAAPRLVRLRRDLVEALQDSLERFACVQRPAAE